MTLYSRRLTQFRGTHPCSTMKLDDVRYRYVLAGPEDAPALVFLNGGMNTLEMWMDYVDALSDHYRVLLFDYPQALRTNGALVDGIHDFLQTLRIVRPILIGASDGGMIAQIYVQHYPGETDALILISTGGMDKRTLRTLKRKYFLAPLMLWYMKRCNYENLKPHLIKAGMRHVRNESPEEIAFAQNMFETIFRTYTREKDVHISGLMADLMKQEPVTPATFQALVGKILLILPDQDFFSGKMQQDLIELMHDPQIRYVSGGHLSTVIKTEEYARTIRDFLESLPVSTFDFSGDDVELIDSDEEENEP